MGKIIVGVDGSPGARAALRFALEEARLRGAVLHAIHAWMHPLYEGVPGPFVVGFPPGPALDEVREQLERTARGALDAALAEEAAAAGGVEVRREVVEGAPARVLLDAARDADLLVVGSRGHGGFVGLLLGSVGAQCARHSPCPVAIVKPPAGDEQPAA
ncbi:MAG: universal stress protein [Thermoleophilia bacterium]|nr:universal stress protein [Thermoleophilia bacterium]